MMTPMDKAIFIGACVAVVLCSIYWIRKKLQQK